MLFISIILVLMSWFNFSSTPIYDFDMIRYLNEAAANSVILNKYICSSDYNINTEWELFIIDQIFIEKGINIIDYETLYDAYENIGLKNKTYLDEWLINYSKIENPEWVKIEKTIIEDIIDAQQLIDEENSWFNRN